jgi:uncharacterized protein (TIGR02246 family)
MSSPDAVSRTRANFLSRFAFCVALAALPLAAAEPPAEKPAPADERAMEALVQAQLEAYNRRDLEGFLAYYADDAVLVDYPDTEKTRGKEAMRTRYAKSFANKDVRAAVTKRIVFGHFVIDHEQITAPPAPGMIEAVAVYEVRDDRIVRVTFLAK